MLKRFMIGLLGIIFQIYASEIVDIDQAGRQRLTCQLFRVIVQEDSLEEISNLVVGGADINAQDLSGASLCHHAAVFNRDDVIEMFCKKDADVNVKDNDGNTPLHYACRHGAYEVAEILLKYGANKWEKNDKNRTSVEIAQKYHRKAIVELIENWYDPLEIKEPDID